MEVGPARLRQRGVGDVANQDVAEAEGRFVRDALLGDQVAQDGVLEVLLEGRGLVVGRDRRDGRALEDPADHRCGLERRRAPARAGCPAGRG